MGSKREKLLMLCLDSIISVVNSSNGSHMDSLPTSLVNSVSCLLLKLWRSHVDLTISSNNDEINDYLHRRKHELCEAIFRLSMNSQCPNIWASKDVETSIFGTVDSFETFILHNWENNPIHLRSTDHPCGVDPIYSSLVQSFNPININTILHSIIQGLVSCPPIASDELDINHFLNEVNCMLGSSVMYGEDIKVVRTKTLDSVPLGRDNRGEEHLATCYSDWPTTDVDLLHKCNQAFSNGYSIALRGMEFRSEAIAAVAVGLADLLGLPSVGANVYFSPPRSQGLAVHYDDHCVFVWQLFGRKRWRVSSYPYCILPRLYEQHDCDIDSIAKLSESVPIVVEKGDILYVPRGYLHEADTLTAESISQEYSISDCSLHLTLAIEVEPPFDWEGFVHIGLHCWSERHDALSVQTGNMKFSSTSTAFSLLLHVAINQLGFSIPVLRKACLVAANLQAPTASRTSLDLLNRQKSTFLSIIEMIRKKVTFAESFGFIELVVRERNEVALRWMNWLRHLPQSRGKDDQVDYCKALVLLEELVVICGENRLSADIKFSDLKFNFCRSVVYEDVCKSFVVLLEKYRATRCQYMNGMLALHRRSGI